MLLKNQCTSPPPSPPVGWKSSVEDHPIPFNLAFSDNMENLISDETAESFNNNEDSLKSSAKLEFKYNNHKTCGSISIVIEHVEFEENN